MVRVIHGKDNIFPPSERWCGENYHLWDVSMPIRIGWVSYVVG